MKYTEENINKLECVFNIMVTLADVKESAVKHSKLQQVCQLLYEVGLVNDPNDTTSVMEIYNQHLLNRIREIVQKSQ